MVYATSNEIKYGISIQRVLHETSNCASALVCIRAKIITIWIYKEVKDKSTLNLLMPQQVTQCCKTHLNSLPIEWTHSGYLNQQNTSYPPPHPSLIHTCIPFLCLLITCLHFLCWPSISMYNSLKRWALIPTQTNVHYGANIVWNTVLLDQWGKQWCSCILVCSYGYVFCSNRHPR